jgi:hypothetical protein
MKGWIQFGIVWTILVGAFFIGRHYDGGWWFLLWLGFCIAAGGVLLAVYVRLDRRVGR